VVECWQSVQHQARPACLDDNPAESTKPRLDEDDFFRFRADPFKSCDKGKEFRIDAVKFVGWPDNGKAAVERHGEYWYLKPATAGLPRD
jgi:hypothetical protein